MLAGVQGFTIKPLSLDRLPAVEPYKQLAFASEETAFNRRDFYSDLSAQEKMSVWNEQLTQAAVLRSQEMNIEQRQLLADLIAKLPEIFLEGKESKTIELQIVESFPDEQLRKDIFVSLGSGGAPSSSFASECNCSYGSSFNMCRSCLFWHNYYCGVICHTQSGCGFLGMYTCDGICGNVKPSRDNCWWW